jgi:hypothetical protein
MPDAGAGDGPCRTGMRWRLHTATTIFWNSSRNVHRDGERNIRIGNTPVSPDVDRQVRSRHYQTQTAPVFGKRWARCCLAVSDGPSTGTAGASGDTLKISLRFHLQAALLYSPGARHSMTNLFHFAGQDRTTDGHAAVSCFHP